MYKFFLPACESENMLLSEGTHIQLARGGGGQNHQSQVGQNK